MNVSAEAVLVILVLVIAVGLLVAGWLSSSATSRERAREANLREQVVRADARVTRDHQAAPRSRAGPAGGSGHPRSRLGAAHHPRPAVAHHLVGRGLASPLLTLPSHGQDSPEATAMSLPGTVSGAPNIRSISRRFYYRCSRSGRCCGMHKTS